MNISIKVFLKTASILFSIGIFLCVYKLGYTQCNCYRLDHSTFTESELKSFCKKHYAKYSHKLMKDYLVDKCYSSPRFLDAWIKSYGLMDNSDLNEYEFDPDFCDKNAENTCFIIYTIINFLLIILGLFVPIICVLKINNYTATYSTINIFKNKKQF